MLRILVLILLFTGALMIADGVYEQKLAAYKKQARIEYRFIPRTFYEEQMNDHDLSLKMKDMFQKDAPWFWRDTIDTNKRS
jgi:hypothetical protein